VHFSYQHTSVDFRRLLDNCLPQCVTSQCPLTAKHILIECNAFCDVHHKYVNVA